MLNELALLRKGILDVNNQALKRIHKNLGEPGKTNIIRVILNEEGKITELELLEGPRNKNYWSHGDGNHNKFPDIKLPSPLRPRGVEEYRKWSENNPRPTIENQISCFKDLRDKYPFEPEHQICQQRYLCKLRERSLVYANLEGGASIVSSLIEIFLAIIVDSQSLLEHFDEMLWKKVQRDAEGKLLKFASLVMFAGGLKPEVLKGGKFLVGNRPTFLFDLIKDGTTHSAAHKFWKEDISDVLSKHEQHSNKSKQGNCVISGQQHVDLVSDKFPAAKCQSLGNVITFSRKEGVETYRRYGKLATDSISVSANLADELKSALEYLNAKEQGTTWDLLPSEAGGNDLLLTFCRAYPDIDIAKLVAHDDELDDLLDESGYELEASQICKAFKGNDIDLSVEPRIDFLILRKISDGVQKAIFSSSIPIRQLETQSENWNRACKNVPSIQLKLFIPSRKENKYCSSSSISPKQFALIFRKNYSRSIDDKQNKVPGIAFTEVMELFLNDGCSSDMVRRLLNKILKQFSNLLELAALRKTNPKKHHPDSLYVITAMGLLLYKSGRKKEVYMKELAYKLGQFCSALDEIHIGYCESERKGQEPGRLIGNQAYAAAVVNPRKALEITAQRFAVYKSWADKNSREEDKRLKEKAKNAKYANFWLRKHSKELYQLIPEKIPVSTPESRAELLLGYLAGREITKKKDSNHSES